MFKKAITTILLFCMVIGVASCNKTNPTSLQSDSSIISNESLTGSSQEITAGTSDETGLTSTPEANSGTSSSTKSNGSQSAISKANDPNVLGLQKYKTPVTLTTFRKSSDEIERDLAKTTDKETIEYNRYNRLFEEKLNIKLKYLWIAKGDSYTTKLNLALSSGQLPDFFQVNAMQAQQLYKAGKIQSLTKVYSNYATDLTKKTMLSDATENDTFTAVTFNKELYAIPRTWSSYDSAEFLWVRTDWLKKYNLPEPTTIQNMMTIAKRFAKEDPDGNGKTDTIGLGLQKAMNGNAGGIVGFLNGYHGYLDLFLNKNGKVVFSEIQPEVKRALLDLHSLYKEGAISQEFANTDFGVLCEKVISGKVGMFYGEHWMPLNPLLYNWEMDEKAEWKAYPIPSVDAQPANVQIYTGTTDWWVVNKSCKNPEAIVKLINIMYAPDKPEYVTRQDVTIASTFSPIFVQDPLINIKQMNSLKDYIAGKNVSATDYQQSYIPEYKLYKSGKLQYWWVDQIYCVKDSPINILVNNYIQNKRIIRSDLKGGIATPTMIKKGATLDKLISETFVEMIIGTKTTGDFDAMAQNWLKLGGQDIINEITTQNK